MILYFSGTGNSKFVAEELGSKLGEPAVSLFTYIREGKPCSFDSECPFVFVTPTYAWRIPHAVEKLIKASSFAGCIDAYFVLTCGDSIGSAGNYAKKLCEETGLSYKGIFKIVMPENYIAMFNAPEKEEAISIVKNSLSDIDKAARYIAQGKSHEIKINVADSLLSSAINPIFYALFVKDKAFKVSDDCISCGLCEKLCPLNNISLKEGKPVWSGSCTHCMACICSCPKNAIEYGKKSIGQPRYRCPNKSEISK